MDDEKSFFDMLQVEITLHDSPYFRLMLIPTIVQVDDGQIELNTVEDDS